MLFCKLPQSSVIVSAASLIIIATAGRAYSQVDPNIQSRLNAVTVPLILTPNFNSTSDYSGEAYSRGYLKSDDKNPPNCKPDEKKTNVNDNGACIKPVDYANHLDKCYKGSLTWDVEQRLYRAGNPTPDDLKHEDELNYKAENAISDALAALKKKFSGDDIFKCLKKEGMNILAKTIAASPVNFCKAYKSQLETAPTPGIDDRECQKPDITIKISPSFNPDYESNVFKSNQNLHPDTSYGLGGLGQVIIGVPSLGLYDLAGASIQSTSSRYDKYPSRDLDAIITQGALQFFIDAFYYRYSDEAAGGNAPVHCSIGEKCDIPANIDPKKPYFQMPAQGLITVDTLQIGIQNQASYKPTFGPQTADLITPQITLSRQNLSLLDNQATNVCEASLPDFRKNGFCWYADLSATIGQTSSSTSTLENANFAVSASLGRRFDGTDWKLALQTTVTDHTYEYVPGGRKDLLVQAGPVLTYAPPPLQDAWGQIALQFSLPATYNHNYSTILKDEWDGWVIMPTLTLAFQPAPKMKE